MFNEKLRYILLIITLFLLRKIENIVELHNTNNTLTIYYY